jgi:hypothetical protein
VLNFNDPNGQKIARRRKGPCPEGEVLVPALCTSRWDCTYGSWCYSKEDSGINKPQLIAYCAKLTPNGTPIFTPRSACEKKLNLPRTTFFIWYHCRYTLHDFSNGTKEVWQTDCDKDLELWIQNAGQAASTPGHTACLRWCQDCLVGPGKKDPVSGHLIKACIDNICNVVYS